jgi:hypothetical protein
MMARTRLASAGQTRLVATFHRILAAGPEGHPLLRTGFLPLAFDVFCGMAPRTDEFLRLLASIVVTRRTGYSEGPHFSPNYAILFYNWRTRLSLTMLIGKMRMPSLKVPVML